MSANPLVEKLVETSAKERSAKYKIVATFLGATSFVVILPGILFLAGTELDKRYLAEWAVAMKWAIGVGCVGLGLLWALWALLTQLTAGRGTPVPLAPTQKLIVSGPYRFSRNPMQLGMIVYYFGAGTLLGSVRIGLVMFLVGLVLGALYHKLIEERELARRFGKDYEDYKARTPFLIPKL